jgi:hypothetical protein
MDSSQRAKNVNWDKVGNTCRSRESKILKGFSRGRVKEFTRVIRNTQTSVAKVPGSLYARIVRKIQKSIASPAKDTVRLTWAKSENGTPDGAVGIRTRCESTGNGCENKTQINGGSGIGRICDSTTRQYHAARRGFLPYLGDEFALEFDPVYGNEGTAKPQGHLQ